MNALVRNLTREEIAYVSGGEGSDEDEIREIIVSGSSGGGGNWNWDNDLRDWGAKTMGVGTGVMAAGGALIVADGVLPIGDIPGIPIVSVGSFVVLTGALGFFAGSVGGALDFVNNFD